MLAGPRFYSLKRRRLPAGIGAKARNLGFLLRRGTAVPDGWVCAPGVCANLLEGRGAQEQALRGALAGLLDEATSYAVRSSAAVEDGSRHSFAGQFRTVLGARGVEQVAAAVGEVCRSGRAPEVLPYLSRSGRLQEPPAMAVIVQKMADPVCSGVSFSRNPITGLAEIVVEAVAGSGERLVQEGITPERWVSKWGLWQLRPEQGVLPLEVAEQVVRETRRIARAFRRPADLEWVWDGAKLWWVQLRPITTVGELNVYSDHIAREMLPGQVKPLVWSINIPLVNTAWVRLLTELIGPNDIDPLTLARQFAYRTYFNMGAIGRVFEALGMPADSLELMMGVKVEGPDKPRLMPSLRAMRHAGRMLRFALDKLRFDRRTARFLPQARTWYDEFRRQDLAALDPPGLLQAADRLFQYTLRTAYFNVVAPFLMMFYNRLLKRRLERYGQDLASIDLTRGLTALAELDPNAHLARLAGLLEALDPERRQRLLAGDAVAAAGAAAFRREFHAFLECFGHLSDSGVDFSYVPWREDPGRVLGMIAGHRAAPPPPHGGTGAPRPSGAICTLEDLPLSRRERRRLEPLYKRARKFHLLREQISSLYIYGYGTFRDLFLELGRRLAGAGRLGEAAEIFYLYLPEVRRAVEDPGYEIAALGSARRAEMAASASARLPGLIFGDDPPGTDHEARGTLRGVPTSRGRYRGPARVVRDTTQFPRLQPGDVLVIPFSDVGWTPLFARAGAVVAESGGILSHSSIVAREYGIPAVVSVEGAMDLEDGVTLEVDGYTGEVFVHTEGRGSS